MCVLARIVIHYGNNFGLRKTSFINGKVVDIGVQVAPRAVVLAVVAVGSRDTSRRIDRISRYETSV